MLLGFICIISKMKMNPYIVLKILSFLIFSFRKNICIPNTHIYKCAQYYIVDNVVGRNVPFSNILNMSFKIKINKNNTQCALLDNIIYGRREKKRYILQQLRQRSLTLIQFSQTLGCFTDLLMGLVMVTATKCCQ